MLRYLRRNQIDDDRWNAAISTDPTKLLYGFTWWLDAAAAGRWHALVLDDYRVVFPLPYARSVGKIIQIRRPPFTQQIGPWGDVRPGDVERLLRAVPRTALRFDLPLRENLPALSLPTEFTSRHRTNYVIDLTQPWEAVRQAFQRILRRKLRKHAEPVVLTQTHPNTIIDLYAPSAGAKAGLKAVHYTRVTALMKACAQRSAAQIVRLDCPSHGLLAAGFFPTHRGRLINLFAASSPEGYQKEGMARLLVHLMRGNDHHSPTLFDFEGSDLPGVKEFFKSFGPVDRGYTHVSR